MMSFPIVPKLLMIRDSSMNLLMSLSDSMPLLTYLSAYRHSPHRGQVAFTFVRYALAFLICSPSYALPVKSHDMLRRTTSLRSLSNMMVSPEDPASVRRLPLMTGIPLTSFSRSDLMSSRPASELMCIQSCRSKCELAHATESTFYCVSCRFYI